MGLLCGDTEERKGESSQEMWSQLKSTILQIPKENFGHRMQRKYQSYLETMAGQLPPCSGGQLPKLEDFCLDRSKALEEGQGMPHPQPEDNTTHYCGPEWSPGNTPTHLLCFHPNSAVFHCLSKGFLFLCECCSVPSSLQAMPGRVAV